MKQSLMTSPPAASEAGAVHPVCERTGDAGSAADTSVRMDTGWNQEGEKETEITSSGYKRAERAAIDDANEVFSPVIEADVKAVERLEDIEHWAPSLVRGVRAIRDRATRETGALNRCGHHYKKRFGDLLIVEPIGPWLLDKNRRADLDAVHYLGDDGNLDKFMDWRATKMTEKDRKRWRKLRTQVEHFKKWRKGAVGITDRRTSAQRAIEQVRADGHKADAASLAQIEQLRRELITGIETAETLSLALDHAGVEKVVDAILACQTDGFARTVYELLGNRLKEPIA
jgi:hypothetical protein